MKYVLIALLKVWRLVISPLYGNVCRYYPSCSAYALRAVQHHGAVRGTWYAGRRLLRCHPWSAGGYDPVPGTPEHEEEMRAQAAAAVTMDEGAAQSNPEGTTPDVSISGADRGVRDGMGSSSRGTTERERPHTMQGRAVTVEQLRGGQ